MIKLVVNLEGLVPGGPIVRGHRRFGGHKLVQVQNPVALVDMLLQDPLGLKCFNTNPSLMSRSYDLGTPDLLLPDPGFLVDFAKIVN